MTAATENENALPSAPISFFIDGLARVIRGKRETLEMVCAALLARGHILLDDNPGLGKTTLARAIAAQIGDSSFKRIQFTPDLLPYDITGVDVFDPESRSFRFVSGPVFATVVLADEINRASPKTQSALLEVMGERQVTIGQATYPLAAPFFVIATENPIDAEDIAVSAGTFPLPAAELDRFMVKLSLGYPERGEEIAIVTENPGSPARNSALSLLQPLLSGAELVALQEQCDTIYCHPTLIEAAVNIVRATRDKGRFLLGASPRAGLHYIAAARALAFVRGRDFVTDDDLRTLAVPVLAHRLKAKEAGDGKTKTVLVGILMEIADGILANVKTI